MRLDSEGGPGPESCFHSSQHNPSLEFGFDLHCFSPKTLPVQADGQSTQFSRAKVANSKIDKHNENGIIKTSLDVIVIKQAQRELALAPRDFAIDIFSLFEEIAAGKTLVMPISRPLFSIARGLHELRLSGRAGEYRVFYVIRAQDGIYVIHAATKKKQTLDRRTASLLKRRIKDQGI